MDKKIKKFPEFPWNSRIVLRKECVMSTFPPWDCNGEHVDTTCCRSCRLRLAWMPRWREGIKQSRFVILSRQHQCAAATLRRLIKTSRFLPFFWWHFFVHNWELSRWLQCHIRGLPNLLKMFEYILLTALHFSDQFTFCHRNWESKHLW